MLSGFFQDQPSGSGTLPIPTTPSPRPKVVARELEVTKDPEVPTNNGSTENVQPPVVSITIMEPVVALKVTLFVEPVAPKLVNKDSLPYPSRLNYQKRREKENN
ncbi:hypothetical protein Tco_0466109, partial [Tanacetum coccineum]